MAQRREDVLEALGLSGCTLGPSESVPWIAPVVGHARGVDVRQLTSAFLASVRVVPISAGLLGTLGLSAFAAADASGLIKFTATGPVSIRVAGPTEGRVVQSPSEPHVAWVDASGPGAFLVETRAGRILLTLEESELHMQTVVARLSLPPLVAIEEPAEPWMRSSSDAWLHAEASRALASRGAWSVCVAAGMPARASEPGAFGSPHETVQALLRGESPSWLSGPRRWVRALQPDQVETMKQLALAEVDRLSSLAANLEAAEPDREEWLAGWRRLCHGRDELEGVRTLLSEVRASAELDAHVGPLDRSGAWLRARAPLARLGHDERMRRAQLADADAWWGWLG
jgi:hypothetical protein